MWVKEVSHLLIDVLSLFVYVLMVLRLRFHRELRSGAKLLLLLLLDRMINSGDVLLAAVLLIEYIRDLLRLQELLRLHGLHLNLILLLGQLLDVFLNVMQVRVHERDALLILF